MSSTTAVHSGPAPVAPAVTAAPVVIQHSNAALVTCDADLRGALSVQDECYIVAPGGVTDEQIAQAVQAGSVCCYVTAEQLGGLLVTTELFGEGISVARVIDPVTDEELARFDRGLGLLDCGPGDLDALECALDRAREILAERNGGDDATE